MGNTPSGVPSPRDVEQASPGDKNEAERLLTEAGSTDMAQRATEPSNSPPPTQSNDAFARQWGFASYLSLFEASKPVSTDDAKNWLVTNVGTNRWIVWNEQDLRADATFPSFDDAARQAGQAVPTESKPPANAPPTG